MNLLTQTTMINYSIIMRSVNANLLAINQAKSRINQAKKEGKTSGGTGGSENSGNTDQGNTGTEGGGGEVGL